MDQRYKKYIISVSKRKKKKDNTLVYIFRSVVTESLVPFSGRKRTTWCTRSTWGDGAPRNRHSGITSKYTNAQNSSFSLCIAEKTATSKQRIVKSHATNSLLTRLPRCSSASFPFIQTQKDLVLSEKWKPWSSERVNGYSTDELPSDGVETSSDCVCLSATIVCICRQNSA